MADNNNQEPELKNVSKEKNNYKNSELHKAIHELIFEDKNFSWVSHHLETCNYFYEKGIQKIFRENNPIQLYHHPINETDDTNVFVNNSEYKYDVKIYLGGKTGERIYYGKPVVSQGNTDNEYDKVYMYPNEARLNN